VGVFKENTQLKCSGILPPEGRNVEGTGGSGESKALPMASDVKKKKKSRICSVFGITNIEFLLCWLKKN